ncbi:MAG: SurA N-terminal domain-containing protein [Gammaproteobacteria bacterium]|nr:SurA N-terminal domain-containing protein [Gammaproteobacteria bacterium]
MLQNIRDNSKGIVAKILVSLIAFTFVIWGAEALFSFSTDNSTPAEVNGEEISLQELLQTAELQRRQILASNPDIDPVTLDQQAIQSTALQQLIAQRVMLQYTQQNDLALSDAAVDQMIIQSADFQVDGVFDRELFESLLRNFGLTPTTYRQQLKRGNLIGQVQQAVSSTAFTLDESADLVARLDGQTRDIAVLTLPLAIEMLSVTMQPSEIDAYYQDNAAQFMTPEQVSVSYVTLNKSDFFDDITVSDEDLKNAYLDAQQEALLASEVEASHMLFMVNDSQTQDQALSLAQAAFAKLEQGLDFASVAKGHSEDESTSSEGGYIGLLAKGEFGDDFDTALFDLSPGSYSAPVVTEFGVQIIYAHAQDPSNQPSFEDQKQALSLALKQAGAESLFVAASEAMADIAFSSPDLLEVADSLGLAIESSALFGRQGGEGIASYDRVVTAAFGDDVLLQGNNSTVLELASDMLVVVRINQHNEPAQQPIEDVKVDITKQLVATKAAAALDAKANAYLEQLNSGADINVIATKENLSWQQFDDVARGSALVNGLLVQSAFRLPRPDGKAVFGLASSYSGDISLIQLHSVDDADAKAQTAQQRVALVAALTRLQGQADIQLLERTLNNKAVIETF